MSDWKTQLLVTSNGTPRPLLANAITAFREAPAWFGVLAYDEFSRETVIKAAPPWDIRLAPWSERVWSSHDDLLATEWLQREDIAVNTQTTAQAVEAVARDRAFHRNFRRRLPLGRLARFELMKLHHVAFRVVEQHAEMRKIDEAFQPAREIVEES